MSRNRMKARDKVSSKMTKDGLVSRNETTGEVQRESSREQSFDLRGEPQAPQPEAKPRRQPQNQPQSPQNDQPHHGNQCGTDDSQRRRQAYQEKAPEAPQGAPQATADAAGQVQTYSPIGDTPEQAAQKPDSPAADKREAAPASDTPAANDRYAGQKPDLSVITGSGAAQSADFPADSERGPMRTPDSHADSGREAPREMPRGTPQEQGQTTLRPKPRDARIRLDKPMPDMTGKGQDAPDTPDGKAKPEQKSRLRFEDTAQPGGASPKDKNKHARRHITDAKAPEPMPAQGSGAPGGSRAQDAASDPAQDAALGPGQGSAQDTARSPTQDAKRDAAHGSGQNAAPDAAHDETHDDAGAVGADAGTADPSGGDTQAAPAPGSDTASPQQAPRLQFKPDEAAPAARGALDKPAARKLATAQRKSDRANAKLEKAQDKLPTKRKLKKVAVFNEQTGQPKRKLQFEKQVKPQSQHIKGALPLRPVKAGANTLMLNAHRKLYQVEHENTAIKAAHRGEMLAEAGIRSALRFHKTAPYRNVAKLEKKAMSKSVNLAYRKALSENPKLRSSMLSRMMQKRKIKKQYAKAAREAKKAAQNTQKAGSAAIKVLKAVGGFIKRHPIASTVVILLLAIVFFITNIVGLFGGAGGGGAGVIAASTYLAEDADILGAQAAYAGMEAELQDMLDNYETLNPCYDEYVYDLDRIWHDPYVLISILGALHEGAWTLDDVQATLAMLFGQQYTLTETTTSETRTRTETVETTDPATGVVTEESEDVEYTHYIRTVTLDNFNLSHLPIYIMGEYGLSRYAMYMMTLGNRPDLFPVGAFPNASYYQDYGRHDVPQAYLDADPVFAAIMAEAEKWLGMPYVWGGYSPVTSFDCSGYVSWVLNQSGWNIGRLGAQGLHSISATVPAADAKPGDLIFFHSTYDAPNPDGATHVGIYVGDGMMVHCGNPIGFVSITTSYWQEHFLAFGRMY